MAQRRNRVQEGFNLYRTKVMPKNASEVQVKECRRAFYAGADYLFRDILLALSPDHEPTEADLQNLTNLEAEFADFAERIKRGEV